MEDYKNKGRIERVKVKEVKVAKVEIIKPLFKSKNNKLLNLTIEDDESFALNHIITHNTGPRGAQKFIRFGSEERPDFSLPFIVPKHASVLAWVTKGERPTSPAQWRQAQKEGRAVYAKKTKGMNPHPFLRPALFELQTVYLKDITLQVMKEHELTK